MFLANPNRALGGLPPSGQGNNRRIAAASENMNVS